MNRGDIWFVSLEPTRGREQREERPVFIVSNHSLNRLGTPIVLPITTGGGLARSTGLAVSLMGTGLRTTGIIRCDQPRALDLQDRGGKRIETAPDFIVEEVLSRFLGMFE